MIYVCNYGFRIEWKGDSVDMLNCIEKMYIWIAFAFENLLHTALADGVMNQRPKLTILLLSRHDWDPRFWDELRSCDQLVETGLQSSTQGQDMDKAVHKNPNFQAKT